MGREYSMELVERAEQLYCVDGQTFEAVSTLTNVAASTLKRWSEKYGWPEKRKEIRRALSSIRTNTILLRARLIRNCMETLNAQDAFAVASIESVAQKAAGNASKTDAAMQREPEGLREIKSEADAIAALEEAVEIRINSMLSNPGRMNLAAFKEIKSVLDLLKDLKARSKPGEEAPSTGLSAEAAAEIRRKILGARNG